MSFDIPKGSDERFKNIRTLTCQIQDRLEDAQLVDFVRDIELLKEKVLYVFNVVTHQYSLFEVCYI